VAGDFNLVPLNRAYRPLTQVASDTWAAAGWGFGFTFPDQPKGDGRAFTLPPLVRIDYLWHSSSLHPRSIRILPSDTGSDHRGLVAEYLVP
ncbi:MAG TPA: endonuclease/exonuclease/phosphatase family protein, partial [Ardenticatenaceae bacterium]|nr:endonuclease/exonuclease/phosphatase family protein [Ardenticatenaceae bacterium]